MIHLCSIFQQNWDSKRIYEMKWSAFFVKVTQCVVSTAAIGSTKECQCMTVTKRESFLDGTMEATQRG